MINLNKFFKNNTRYLTPTLEENMLLTSFFRKELRFYFETSKNEINTDHPSKIVLRNQ
jgi:hypothetical protein